MSLSNLSYPELCKKILGPYFSTVLYGCTLVTTLVLFLMGHSLFGSYLGATVFFMGGIQGLWAAAAHLLFPKTTATQIGWPSSGFQTEMGGTNLALGISGILTLWVPHWVIPVSLILAIVFAVCAYAHLFDLFAHKNKAPCNSGPMLYVTILVSITIFISLYMM